MQRLAILFFLLLTAVVSHPQGAELTTEHLGLTTWEWHSSRDLGDWPKYELQLPNTGRITQILQYSSAGGSYLEAEWEPINQREIWLRYTEYDAGSGETVELETSVRMAIRRLPDSLYHEYALYVNETGVVPDLVLLCRDISVRPNLHREVGAVPVVTLGAVFGETTQNVRIRTAPRVQAGIFKYLEPEAAELDYCPKGKQILVIARTLEKERVQQWTNYWYYVELFASWGLTPRYGWMFGEFITYSENGSGGEEVDPETYEYD